MRNDTLESMPVNMQASTHAPENSGGELDLFAFALLLRSSVRQIAAFAIAGLIIMTTYALVVKPRFTATAAILIPQQSANAAGLYLQSASGGLDLLGGGNEVYIDILRSRTIADKLIAKNNLMTRYKAKEQAQAVAVLATRTTVVASKEGMVRVSVEDEDPAMATQLTNGYLQELDKLNQNLAITAAGQQRKYYEQEMRKEKDALADAEVALEKSQQRTGMIEPQLQAQAEVGASESTRALLRARQVELGALLQGATVQNPEVIRLKAEIAGLAGQVQAMQTGGGLSTGTPASKVPEQALTIVRNSREVKYHEALFQLLAKQYETAKLQEAKDISVIEVLDLATPPEHKSWPPRTLYCLVGLLAGAVLGVVYVIARAFLMTVVLNPENKAKYSAYVVERTRQQGKGFVR